MSHNLPTPQPSTEILPGKRGGSLSEHNFVLPPAAIAGGHASDSASMTSPSPVNSDSSYRPLSPPSNQTPKAAARRKSNTAAGGMGNGMVVSANQGSYELPPPPTRSRKIIQMKPGGQTAQDQVIAPAPGPSSTISAPASSNNTGKGASTQGGNKRKQAGAGNTAASRKIARKTAHSLIERRRRSKMNEEFGVLKDMIPACRGQEMHKLAILQASIEYMRYLEQCLSDLKSAHAHCGASAQQPQLPPFSHLGRHGDSTPTAASFRDEEGDSDEEMDEDEHEATSPHSIRPRSGGSIHSHQPSISPAILPSAQTSPEIMSKPGKFGNYSSSTYHSHNHSARSSALPSPAFEPQTQASGPGGYGANFAPLTSPALRPQGDGTTGLEKDDHEATAALLMLNTDRRSWSSNAGGSSAGGRSMSVRDLLSG